MQVRARFDPPKAGYQLRTLNIGRSLEITCSEGGGDLWDEIYILVEGVLWMGYLAASVHHLDG